MQQALADYGIRYIRGRIVRSEAEAEAFYKELGTQHTVIKRVRGAATQGLHLCNGLDELMAAVRTELALSASDENYCQYRVMCRQAPSGVDVLL